jgi:hypothetical protein
MKYSSKKLGTALIVACGLAMAPVAPAQNMDSQNQGKPKVGSGASMDNPSSFGKWTDEYARNHNGRISRQAYMDEAGRRWDSMDRGSKGLTTADINRLYGGGSGNSQMRDVKGGS